MAKDLRWKLHQQIQVTCIHLMNHLIFANGPGTPESDSNDERLANAVVASFAIGVVATIWVALVVITGLLIHNYV